ncbi:MULTISPECIES: SoxR reducing system RseC family protein [unclassified Candidatus Frackibacter]|uniref:SoxR reducing system RseC family protein n=1 Tax=unclassified Candidatus Frackibacter TaxID=2648818 RepID=UPI000791EBA3|nr:MULTISPECIES: SoxR reducing system RseC family protein [unclassified Candidatus Frackibacter]KXS42897.1 MAG: sigma-E factor negative regulatory protein RseC [Candidatus Frackibacter sp. T328-2]SDC71043.1 positive regulator of sigma(E), RseC/MucC [Candidatus Frackibacter sp. WG11]SEM84522.1 positive regulator of sigma(E), RseC/MucC [Candidatus Frackibacter sp. WG12]SFL93718.1 positive regulator of sigma(E), RseC/MucC [Candidatus Frackibacter sp. WG13]
MREYAEVKEVDNGLATVEIKRAASCDKCGKCSEENKDLQVKAKNIIGAKPGQLVVIELEDKNLLGAVFIVYLLPLINLFVGYFAGSWLSNNYGFGNADLVGGVTGILFLVLSFVFVRQHGERGSEMGKYQPIIKRVFRGNLEDVLDDDDHGHHH